MKVMAIALMRGFDVKKRNRYNYC